MTFFLGLLVPVLAYGVLCAFLGIWVRDTIRIHWPTMGEDTAARVLSARVSLLSGLKDLLGRIGR
jgi:hypothetical protein